MRVRVRVRIPGLRVRKGSASVCLCMCVGVCVHTSACVPVDVGMCVYVRGGGAWFVVCPISTASLSVYLHTARADRSSGRTEVRSAPNPNPSTATAQNNNALPHAHAHACSSISRASASGDWCERRPARVLHAFALHAVLRVACCALCCVLHARALRVACPCVACCMPVRCVLHARALAGRTARAERHPYMSSALRRRAAGTRCRPRLLAMRSAHPPASAA